MPKIVISSLAIFLKKMTVFGNFLTFKWQFSGRSVRNPYCVLVTLCQKIKVHFDSDFCNIQEHIQQSKLKLDIIIIIVIYGWLQAGVSDLTSNLARMAPNRKNLGAHRANVKRKLILKSPRFVPFGAYLTHFGWQICHVCCD